MTILECIDLLVSSSQEEKCDAALVLLESTRRQDTHEAIRDSGQIKELIQFFSNKVCVEKNPIMISVCIGILTNLAENPANLSKMKDAWHVMPQGDLVKDEDGGRHSISLLHRIVCPQKLDPARELIQRDNVGQDINNLQNVVEDLESTIATSMENKLNLLRAISSRSANNVALHETMMLAGILPLLARILSTSEDKTAVQKYAQLILARLIASNSAHMPLILKVLENEHIAQENARDNGASLPSVLLGAHTMFSVTHADNQPYVSASNTR